MTRKLSIKEFEATGGTLPVEFIGIFDSFLDLMIDVGKSERLGDKFHAGDYGRIYKGFLKGKRQPDDVVVFDGNEWHHAAPQIIRTLGLYQPFAFLIMHGKTIETRWVAYGRKPPFPLGTYLIYSCKSLKWLDEISMKAGEETADGKMSQATRAFNTYIDVDPEKEHQKFMGHFTGCALCLVDVVGIIDPLTQDHSDLAFVDVPDPGLAHFRGSAATGEHVRMIGLRLENIRPIKPFEFKGKQGIGHLTQADMK